MKGDAEGGEELVGREGKKQMEAEEEWRMRKQKMEDEEKNKRQNGRRGGGEV
jgi:hypothetical protein